MNEIVRYIQQKGVKHLYHFTDVRNLPSIVKLGGLKCRRFLEENNLEFWGGGNKLSRQLNGRYGNDNYIALAWWPRIPMLKRLQGEARHMCYLMVKVEVCGASGVLFTDSNATSTGHQRLPGWEGLELVDFNLLRRTWDAFNNQELFSKIQAEVLVPGEIPLDLIEAVVCRSEGSRKEVERLLRPLKRDLKIVVDKSLFHSIGAYVVNYRVVSFQGINKLAAVFELDSPEGTKAELVLKDRFCLGRVYVEKVYPLGPGRSRIVELFQVPQRGLTLDFRLDGNPWICDLPVE